MDRTATVAGRKKGSQGRKNRNKERKKKGQNSVFQNRKTSCQLKELVSTVLFMTKSISSGQLFLPSL
jgi:hypothetical protein